MRSIDNRKLIWILGGLLLLVTAAFGWSLTRGYEEKKEEVREEVAARRETTDKTACASNATYARLKEVAFEEAMRQRTGDNANLDTLAAHSVVRMENPVVMNRDEELNITVCSGRFILELPPGAERAFGGQRRLAADIEYSAQAAVDGSGLVYQIRGADPLIGRLAAFDLQGGSMPTRPPSAEEEVQFAETLAVEAAPAEPELVPVTRVDPPQPTVAVRSDPAPRAPDEPPVAARQSRREPARAERGGSPSFNCRYARSASERAVCDSPALAARDRAMASVYYSTIAEADGATRRRLRRTRDRFLAYRERCRSEACIADAYEGRIREIEDIAAER